MVLVRVGDRTEVERDGFFIKALNHEDLVSAPRRGCSTVLTVLEDAYSKFNAAPSDIQEEFLNRGAEEGARRKVGILFGRTHTSVRSARSRHGSMPQDC